MKSIILVLIILVTLPIAQAKKEKEKSALDWKVLSEFDYKAGKVKDKGELKKLLDKKVTMRGFAIPVEFKEKLVTELILAPYYPSCAHVPPPPPNQAVYIKLKKGVAYEKLFAPIEVKGVLGLQKDNESAGFLMKSPDLKPVKF